MLTHKELKARALRRPSVRAEYERLKDEFAYLDEILKARFSAGLTQAEVARRIGTTQSAVARLESGSGGHSPSIATLAKYAKALGYKLDIRLVKGASTAGAGPRSPKKHINPALNGTRAKSPRAG